MAKFLTTSGTSYYLEQLIVNATSELVLVTPYLKLSPNFVDRLIDADKKGVHIIFIYGKDRLKQQEWSLLNELENTNIFYCENLHAKCYHNEDTLIISSMNFYQYSQENNREMSILVTKEADEQVFLDAKEEIKSIKNASFIQKTASNGNSNDGKISEDVYLDPNYRHQQNFHIPYLFRLLKDTYTETTFRIEEDTLNSTDQIIAEDFPENGIDIQIDDRIFFFFDEQYQDTVWYDKKSQFYENIPEAKIFIERDRLKFYWRERTNVTVSEQTLPLKANSYLGIIDKVVDILEN